MMKEHSTVEKAEDDIRRLQHKIQLGETDLRSLFEEKGNRRFWGGADVVVLDKKSATEKLNQQYLNVITPYPESVTSMFVFVRNAAKDLYDFQNKYDLFTSLGTAVNEYHNSKGDGAEQEVAIAVLDAALEVMGRWRFQESKFDPVIIHGND